MKKWHCILRAIPWEFWDEVFSRKIWGHFIQQCTSLWDRVYFMNKKPQKQPWWHMRKIVDLSFHQHMYVDHHKSLKTRIQDLPIGSNLSSRLLVEVMFFMSHCFFYNYEHPKKRATSKYAFQACPFFGCS